MDKRAVTSIDRCLEDLTGYISARVSNAFIGDKDLDEGLTELIYASSDLIRARAKIDKVEKVTKSTIEVEIPDFMK